MTTEEAKTAAAGKIEQIMAAIPESQRAAASAILAEYGPKFLEMATADAWACLRRIMAGDLNAVAELDASMSDGEFIARVKANTAVWENVAGYNVAREKLRTEILIRTAPVVAGLLLGLVGL